MRTSFALALLAAVGAIAAPTRLLPRQVANANGTAAYNSGITDLDILQFALSLETLEISLYEEGVSKFDNAAFQAAGYSAVDRARFEEIIHQELQHIDIIKKSIYQLGGEPVKPCTYQFNYTDLPSYLNLTDAVNGLGPSAYLGTGGFIKDKVLLTTGSSIGQNEARHNSWLNGVIGRDEFPTTFQLSLSPTQAYSVAAPFIASCPESNPPLKAVTSYPPKLGITNPGYPLKPLDGGATIMLAPGAKLTKTAPRVAFLYSFNTTIVDYNADSMSAVIPNDCAGQSYAVLTTAYQGETLNDDNSLTGLAPFFVDVPASRYANYNYQQRTY